MRLGLEAVEQTRDVTFSNPFQYAAAGSLTNLIDGRAKASRWAYDQYGRVTNKVDGLGTNVFAYGYDADDRVTSRTDDQKSDRLTRREGPSADGSG